MANSSYAFKEVRFVIEDDVTKVWVLLIAHDDNPIGVHGWHYKEFPDSVPVVDIAQRYIEDAVMWDRQNPPV